MRSFERCEYYHEFGCHLSLCSRESADRREGLTGVSRAPTSHWSRHETPPIQHYTRIWIHVWPSASTSPSADCAVLPPLSPITRDNVQIILAGLSALKFANKPAFWCLCLRFLAPVTSNSKYKTFVWMVFLGYFFWVFLNYWYTWKQVLGAVNNESGYGHVFRRSNFSDPWQGKDGQWLMTDNNYHTEKKGH